MMNMSNVKWSALLLGATFLLSGCESAGMRSHPERNAEKGGTAGRIAGCIIWAPYCVPYEVVKNIPTLFPKVDPKDESDPVRSTRGDIQKCRVHYMGKENQPTQWEALERCENDVFDQWAAGGPLTYDAIEAVHRENNALITAQSQGKMSTEEGWLRLNIAMEMATVPITDTAHLNPEIDRDKLRDWQNEQCDSRYDGRTEPVAHDRALCRMVAYTAWARRYGGYQASDLSPMMEANIALENDTRHDEDYIKANLQSAQQQVDIKRNEREQEAARQEQEDKEKEAQAQKLAEWQASPAYKAQVRDETLGHCAHIASAHAQEQCGVNAWYRWGKDSDVPVAIITAAVHGTQSIAQQREQGTLSAEQAQRALARVKAEATARYEAHMRQVEAERAKEAQQQAEAQAAQEREAERAQEEEQRREAAEQEQVDRIKSAVRSEVSSALDDARSRGFTCDHVGSSVRCTPN
ncbi:hypothetical protein [Saccharibacter floricola]|uniref:hypothetical protein n=1 Tax=Saccharibacter floricola TaxID=231053 RepID=UPI00035CF706|nr:hypothetical protein [Saccharibacter floricola]